INKRPLSPTGSKIRHQVSSLLPSNLSKSEKKNLSYVFTRFVLNDTPHDTKWPIVPLGLDNLSAALFTIHMIARLTEKSISWLYPVWLSKTNKLKLEKLQLILQSIDSPSDTKLDEIMNECKELLEDHLVEDILSGQDPLSDKIDGWRGSLPASLQHLEETNRALNRVKKKLTTGLKKADPDIIEIFNRFVEKGLVISKGEYPRSVTKLIELEEEKRNLESRQYDLQATTQKIISEIKEEQASLKEAIQNTTRWNVQALRPDGPTASEHELFLDAFRRNVNILSYRPLVQVCEYLAQSEKPGKPVASEIEQLLSFKRRMAHYALQRLGFVLCEHYFPSLPNLGLRYRFIFTEKQKPGVVSDGLVERLVLGDSEYSGCMIHIEPVDSKGPDSSILPSKHHQMLLNSEILSMRLDLFEGESGKWALEPWKSAAKDRRPTWLYRATEYPASETSLLTQRQLDILGPLCSFRGLRPLRNWMFNQLGYPTITSRRQLKTLLEQKTLRLLYHPALEYCGLPIGMMVVSEFNNAKALNSYIDWMTTRLPYTRIFTDRLTNMAAFIRLPIGSLGVVPGVIRERLASSKSKMWFTSRLLSYRTFLMTVFHRIRGAAVDLWLDPWTH
ncbi:MAG: hypothetical protein ACFFEE_11165, partial [Candidatus Thorarchaeota archaeon]